MTDAFFRFPHTPHLIWLGESQARDDKVLSATQANELLAADVIVEEKVDGANLGFSLDATGQLRVQNRGQYLLPHYSGQFSKLPQWRAVHDCALASALQPGWMAFGEWCAARHSLSYDCLPDWWLLFDVYDRWRQTFQSTSDRNVFAKSAGLATVAELFRGRITMSDLQKLLMNATSRYRAGPVEGLVVRSENVDGLQVRTKLVHPDFTQAIDQHWRNRKLEWNRLNQESAGTRGSGSGCALRKDAAFEVHQGAITRKLGK